MNNELKNELTSHIIDTINDCYEDNDTDMSELHYHAFNEDYYLIGYCQCEEWLKHHDISVFDAIYDINTWDLDIFGEVTLSPKDINPEKVVNLYVYVKGEELINELFSDIDLNDTTKTELLELARGI